MSDASAPSLLHWMASAIARLPLRWLHRIGACIAFMVRLLPMREHKVARRNIALCLPELDEHAQRKLLGKTLVSAAQGVLELAWLWHRPLPEVIGMVKEVVGHDQLSAALAEGRGLIIAAPHLGSWELLNLWLSCQCELAVLYRPPDSKALDAWLNHGRTRAGARTVRAQTDQIRHLVRHLRAGGAIGILPDQQPKRGEGEFAPFFGIDAFTMTLFPELVRRYDVPVVLAYAERLAGAAGWRIVLRRIEPAPKDVAALNRMVESVARNVPAQYQWTYKRFSMRPEGQPKLYR